MKIKLIFTGKTTFPYLTEGVRIFEKRLAHYAPFEVITAEVSKKNASSKNIVILLLLCVGMLVSTLIYLII